MPESDNFEDEEVVCKTQFPGENNFAVPFVHGNLGH